VTLSGAEAQEMCWLLLLGGRRGRETGPRRWVSKDGAAGRSREETSSLWWVI